MCGVPGVPGPETVPKGPETQAGTSKSPLDAEPVRLLASAPEVDPARLQELTGVVARPLSEALAGDAAARGDLAEARMAFLGLAARVALPLLLPVTPTSTGTI